MGQVASARVEEDTSRVEIRSKTECVFYSWFWLKKKEPHEIPRSLQPILSTDPTIWYRLIEAFEKKEPMNKYSPIISAGWYAYLFITALSISLFGTFFRHGLASIFVAVGFGILVALILQSCWYQYALRNFYRSVIKEHADAFAQLGLSLDIEEYWHWYSGDKGYYAMVVVIQPLRASVSADIDLAEVLEISYTSFTRRSSPSPTNRETHDDDISIVEAGLAHPCNIEIPVAVLNHAPRLYNQQQRNHPAVARAITRGDRHHSQQQHQTTRFPSFSSSSSIHSATPHRYPRRPSSSSSSAGTTTEDQRHPSHLTSVD